MHKKQEYLDRIQQENKEPLTAAIKQYYHLLYGDEHPYGQSYTGTGTKESINALRKKDLVDFYNNNYILDIIFREFCFTVTCWRGRGRGRLKPRKFLDFGDFQFGGFVGVCPGTILNRSAPRFRAERW